MRKEKREIEIDLLEILRVLWDNLKYIVLVSLVLGIIGFVASKTLLTPIYEASAKMIVNTRYDENQTVTNDQLTSAKKLVDTYAIIIRSRDVLNQVSADLELEESYYQLQKCVSVHSVNNTPVMQIVVQHENRETALRITAKILEIAPDIIIETVEAGSVKPVEQAYAGDSPVSPNVFKNTVLLALLGFVVSCLVIVVIFLSDNTYKSDLDIHNDLGLPVLGVIPTVDSCNGHTRYGHKTKERK